MVIYFDEIPFYIFENSDTSIKSMHFPEATISITEADILSIDNLYNWIRKSKAECILLQCENKETAIQSIFKLFEIIEAAGGIVENDNEELLFIFRRGKWDLPKGKLESGETIEVCAQREIEEETGATHLSLQHKLMNTYHVYHLNGRDILKICHWYYFRCEEQYELTPQLEEDITKIMWFNKKDVSIPMSNTFGTIRNLIEVFMNKK